MINSRFIMIFIVWFSTGLGLLRIWGKSENSDKQVKILTWLILFFAIAFTFWGREAENLLDQYLNGYPVALFVKLIALVTVAYLFHEMLKIIHNKPSPFKFLDYFAFLAYPISVALFFFYITTRFIQYDQLRYLIIGIRDFIIVIYMLTHFLHRTWLIWKNEEAKITKLKGLLIFLCFVCFCITALGSISAGVLAFFDIDLALYASSVLENFVYVGALFFVLQLLPDYILLVPFIIKRWNLYWRVRKIENYIVEQPTQQIQPRQLYDYSYLDKIIYRSTINILDHASAINQSSSKYSLAAKIQKITAQNPTYEDLIKNISRLQI